MEVALGWVWSQLAYPLILVDMAELVDPRKGVKEEKIIFLDADGNPTKNKDEATRAEITTTFEDGRQEVTLMGRTS